LFTAFVLWYVITWTSEAWGNEPDEFAVMRAVQILQPSHAPPVAAAWAGVIYEAGAETGLDPLLIAAIAFRESSLREGVVGDRGEVGPMQLHGAALRHRPQGCDPADITCSIRGGAAVLQWWQAECNDPRWAIWIGAYGFGRCPSIEEAEDHRSVRRARELYERVGGERWE
jgi:soluble lytic murein transglycosylase-like protein